MGILDDLTNEFIELADFLDLNPEQIANTLESAEDPTEALAALLDAAPLGEQAADILVDLAEEFILNPIAEQGQITPENVEGIQDELEGNATAVIFGFIALTLAIESGTAGQVDEVPGEVLQAVAAIGFEDVTGREIDARLQEGIDPALKQKVHRESRSKQADFQDYVEANLALRKSGIDIDTLDGLGRDVVGASDGSPTSGDLTGEIVLADDLPDYLNPEDFGWLPDPDTYGTVPNQTSVFELASLNVTEPEELIEEPIQYGIPVPKLPVEQANEIRGIPRDAASIYEQVIEELPKTENLLRDYVRLTEFLFRLREKVEAGAIQPQQARQLVEPELRDLIVDAIPPERLREEDRTADEVVDILADEIERNFELLNSLPPDPPSQAQLEAWYRKGVIESQRFADLYELFGEAPEDLDKYLTEEAIDQGWEDIQRQAVLGRISDTEARFRLQLIGYSGQEAGQIIEGADGDAIVQEKIQQRAGRGELSLQIATEIGPVRASQLRAVGIDSLNDMVNAGVGRLTEVTGMSDTEAETAINSAELFLEAEAQRE